jgi:YD repeat-containing protein
MRRPRFKALPGRSRYGRNRFGGVVWRRDDRAHAQTPTAVTTEDNYYLYDGTNQIKERKRGNLAGTPPNYTGIDPIQQQENWTYDASGNWTQYSNPSTAPGHTQVREHNDGNELWKISVSGLGEVWPIYDSMGNMRTLSKAPGVSTDQYTLKWDAWNRLVEVKDGSTVVASYTYDGLNRRLTKTAGSETRHYYYDTQWRTLEERVGSSSTPDRQYTWGLRDRWDLLRSRESGFQFLGSSFRWQQSKKGTPYVHRETSPAAKQALRDRVRALTGHHTTWKETGQAVREINRATRGWGNYFALANCHRCFGQMNDFVAHRLRQWLWRKHGNPVGKYERWPSRELFAAYGLHRLRATL